MRDMNWGPGSRIVLLLCGILFPVAAGADQPKAAADTTKRPEPTRPRMVPAYGWQPSPGDDAVIMSPNGASTIVATRVASSGYLRRMLAQKDKGQIRQLIELGEAVEVPPMAPVMVDGVADTSEHRRLTQLQSGGSRPVMGYVADSTVTAWRVTLKEGKLQGTTVIVDPENLEHLVPEEVKVKAKPRTFKGGTPAARASEAYRAARKLETSGKLKEAIAAYEDLSGGIFPEGRMAKARLKVLTGK